jgi:putative hemolysin
MPTLGSHAEETREPVLSCVADLPGIAAKLTPGGRFRDLYRRAHESADRFTLENLLSVMRIRLRVSSADQARIPARGPVVAVASHPYGVLESAIVSVLLTRIRPDVKILTSPVRAGIPELAALGLFVDPVQTDRSAECDGGVVREAGAWLETGGMLAIFPAQEVSQFPMPISPIGETEWNDTATRLIRRSGASALPLYFCGRHGLGLHFFGMIHPRLRTAFRLQQFLQQEGKTIEIRIGSEIPHDSIAQIDSDREATEYLRWRTYLLARRKQTDNPWPLVMRSRFVFRPQEQVAPPVAAELLESEIASLPPDRCLVENGELAVYLGSARETAKLLQEIGRLREFTFRQVGEGTGKSRDLDRFDNYYWHVLLWNRSKRELVGAYRVGSTGDILARCGLNGLYTSTLFRYHQGFFEKLGPALELGRSFVRPEYQRQYAPLLLLWKGIARLIAMHPEIAVLFGAVSISNQYSKASREVIYRFFQSRQHNDEFAGLVKPRQPFRPGLLPHGECRGLWQAIRDLDQLSHPIKDLESDGKGLPILLRQYDKLGGRLVAFNIDRKFSCVLDGLVVVDLRNTEASVLDRYMGPAAATRFRQLHAAAR